MTIALGADAVINYSEVPEWQSRVRELTNGRGVDHVLEVGGPGTFSKSLEAVRMGGQIHVIGYLGGKRGDVNPVRFLERRFTVRGIPVGSRESFEAMNRALRATSVRPVIDGEFAWTEVVSALRDLAEAKHFGKVVLKISE